jgi:hypothetical protein
MNAVVRRRSLLVRHRPFAVVGCSDGDGHMDMVAAEAMKSIVRLFAVSYCQDLNTT